MVSAAPKNFGVVYLCRFLTLNNLTSIAFNIVLRGCGYNIRMVDLTEEQRKAIKRIDANLEKFSPEEQQRRMNAALSVTRQEVDASLAEKKAKRKALTPSS